MYHCSLPPVQAECEAKLVAVAAMSTNIGASGRAEIRGSAAELPLPLCTGGGGGDNQRVDADCVLVSFRYPLHPLSTTPLVPPP